MHEAALDPKPLDLACHYDSDDVLITPVRNQGLLSSLRSWFQDLMGRPQGHTPASHIPNLVAAGGPRQCRVRPILLGHKEQLGGLWMVDATAMMIEVARLDSDG
jgi:hypothetical protein